MIEFCVENFTFLTAGEATSEQADCYCFDKGDLPVLDWVPAMQRRRLSAFAKMSLFCAYKASNASNSMPVVFSSRHGDLHKTSALLDTLAEKDSLSPTAFSMSVHNASAGLLSILTGNKSASNTISAGRDSLFMAILDAYARLMTSTDDKILVVHCDQALPEAYRNFSDEIQIDHCIAFVMTKAAADKSRIQLSMTEDDTKRTLLRKPQAVDFIDFLQGDKNTTTKILGDSMLWTLRAVA
ncbi:beta-ketoacyl synthase chain length factor [Thalassotalea sp. PLHSN55]|uniref:beta-ketoacyl synthase chain length factor n=1 Tax=Thalassotalea sp. PLHSN55 TaxID=3435888 RepID=UPI003F87947F